MASPIPCAMCGEVADAPWLVTNRSEDWNDDLPRTFGMCDLCWIRMAQTLAENMTAPPEPEPDPEADPDQDEDIMALAAPAEVEEPPAPAPARKSRRQTPETPEAVAEEAEAAHVDG